MGKLTAIATNEYSEYEADIPVTPPQIKKSFWSSDKEGKNKIERAHLEETVYFHIETVGISSGTINLQLFDEDAFDDDDKFGGKEVYKTMTINGNIGVVELYLPDKWATDLAEEEWHLILTTVKLHYRDLYWKATYKSSIKEAKVKTILQIFYSENQLYIKPSTTDDKFPELYSSVGEQIVILVNMAANEAIENVKSSIEEAAEVYAETSMKNAAHNYAVGKIEKGYMITTEGVEYSPTTETGTSRKMQDVKFISKDGKYIETKQGYDFYSRKKGGKLVTTKGVDQYQYHYDQQYSKEFANKDMYYNQKAGCKVKVLGALNKVGTVMDVFSVFKFAANPSHEEPLPIPIPGADVLGMMAYDKFNEIDAYIDEWKEKKIEATLNEAKLEGVDKVRDVINNRGNAYPEFRDAGYEFLDISPELASRIMQGEFKNIDEIIDVSFDSEGKTITLLFRRTKHPVSDKDIAIIETFFIQEQYEY